ncbi:MAG TPA: sigma-70 family RNA polymerase sigma factor, partial [Sedimentisphaerales bacterium]|nr:sigma-70 family RNA polymerase sigma factor [Sedimentisphaerales bacterium]
RGCRESMHKIYDKYKHYLLTLANALLHDTAAAEDVVHDVFVSFAGSIQDFQLRTNLKAYLAKCVRNQALNSIRDRKIHADKYNEICVDGCHCQSPLQTQIDKETSADLRHALANLPLDQREVIVLHIKADLSFRQIASMLDVSINTAQGRYRYGIEKLRSMLNREAQK